MKTEAARKGHSGWWARRARAWAVLGISLGALTGCEGLLEVDLPAELTNEALEDPAGATTQLNSVIVQFESAMNDMAWILHGREDGGEIVIGGGPIGGHVFTYDERQVPFGTLSITRKFAVDLHEKLDKEWTVQQVPLRARYLALTSIYGGATVGAMGGTLCEVAMDGGPLMTSAQTLTMAETMLTRALSEIDAAGGDFALPFGITTSARTLTYGLRAQVRWMQGNNAGALSDAALVPKGYLAFITRESTTGRRNTAYEAGLGGRFARSFDVIDFWSGAPNPVTGQAWPEVIPFTGYINLGILPDGRATREDGLPIRTAGPYRTPAEDAAIPDTRVKTTLIQSIVGTGLPGHVTARYATDNAFIPWVNWKEMYLLRAEIEGGQKAIDLVNELRAADNLPLVTYASATDENQIRRMIIEERRRALFLEGRFYFTKLKNLDLLWFPRRQGQHPGGGAGGATYGGVIRFAMPESEFQLNSNLTLQDQATGCDASQRPIL